jgi:hypothetical protein
MIPMGKNQYSAFGMQVRSYMPLALPPVGKDGVTGLPVDIVRGTVPENLALPLFLGKIRYGRVGDSIQFDVPGIARYSLEGDARILVEALPGASEQRVGSCISGLLLSMFLRGRGIVTLHGSAVCGPRGALAFLGDRGSGKSTTAAALTARGYSMLCDDVIPVSGGPMVLPGIPSPKLLPDAYATLIGNPAEAFHLFDGVDKYLVELPSSRVAAPLRIVFILGTADIERLRIEPMRGAAKIAAILRHSQALAGIDDPVIQFSDCSSILAGTAVYRVLRPRSGDSLSVLVGKILRLDGELPCDSPSGYTPPP